MIESKPAKSAPILHVWETRATPGAKAGGWIGKVHGVVAIRKHRAGVEVVEGAIRWTSGSRTATIAGYAWHRQVEICTDEASARLYVEAMYPSCRDAMQDLEKLREKRAPNRRSERQAFSRADALSYASDELDYLEDELSPSDFESAKRLFYQFTEHLDVSELGAVERFVHILRRELKRR